MNRVALLRCCCLVRRARVRQRRDVEAALRRLRGDDDRDAVTRRLHYDARNPFLLPATRAAADAEDKLAGEFL